MGIENFWLQTRALFHKTIWVLWLLYLQHSKQDFHLDVEGGWGVLVTDRDSLHGLDGGEHLQELADDKGTQLLEALDSLSDKHQHVGGSQLVLVTQELHQLQERHITVTVLQQAFLIIIYSKLRLWPT